MIKPRTQPDESRIGKLILICAYVESHTKNTDLQPDSVRCHVNVNFSYTSKGIDRSVPFSNRSNSDRLRPINLGAVLPIDASTSCPTH